MNAKDEYLDLVDENDTVIGKKLRSEVYAERLSNYRVINAFIINAKGELWIPTRSADKRIFPNCLDMSVAGHVESGEDYDQTFRREALEELNLDIRDVDYVTRGCLSPNKDGVSAFMKVYEIRSDQAPEYNKKDFIGYSWLTPQNVLKAIDDGKKSKDDLPVLIKKFYVDK